MQRQDNYQWSKLRRETEQDTNRAEDHRRQKTTESNPGVIKDERNQAQCPALTSRANCLCFTRKSSQESLENPAWPCQSSRSSLSTQRSPGWNLSLARRPWSSS